MSVDKKELKTRIKQVDELRKQLKTAEKSVAKDIMSLLKILMASNPLLVGMRWNQYTPGYSDGDPCVFGVWGPEFKFVDTVVPIDPNVDPEDEDPSEYWIEAEYDLTDEWWSERTDILNHKQITALKKTVKEAYIVFNKLSAMESEIERNVGDGVQVTVTASGVETEDFDHD